MKKHQKNSIHTEENRVRSLYRSVRKYFNDTIFTEEFTIAVDVTGAYLFTDETDETLVLIRASTVMSNLALHKEDILICMVSEEFPMKGYSSFSFDRKDSFQGAIVCRINASEFEDDIREIIGSRPAVFHTKDIIDIVSCYKRSVLEEDDFSRLLKDFNLPDDTIEAVRMHAVRNPLELIHECGVSPDVAESVFQKLQEFYGENNEKDSQERTPMSILDDRKSSALAALSLVMFLAASAFVLLKLWLFSMIFSVAGILFARESAAVYRTFLSILCRTLNWCILLGALFYFSTQAVPKVLESLKRMTFTLLK